jgi:hypothetical protein
MDNTNLPMTPEFMERVKQFKQDWHKVYSDIGAEQTPEVDGTGKKIIRKRPDGYDYIVDDYMRTCLDKHFPGWSLEATFPIHFLGAEWVVFTGHLVIIDEHLLAFNVVPPLRKFPAVDAIRIQYRTEKRLDPDTKKEVKVSLPHTPDNIVDVGDNCKQVVTAGLKFAINRLCRIGDDVYGKRIIEEGAGTLETVIEMSPSSENFGKWVAEKGLRFSEVFQILEVKDLSQITDYKEAYEKIKKAKGWS